MTTQDLDRAISEIWALFRETDKKNEETRKQMQETDRKMQETERILKEQTQETDKRIEKSNKEFNKKLGALVNRWGEFVENFVAPNIVKIFQEIGIMVNRIYQRSKSIIDDETLEIDILGVNTGFAVVVEVKSNLVKQDVDDFLEDLDKFKRFFPEHKDKKVLGAITGMKMTKEVSRYAYSKGLYVLGQTGDTLKILNDKKFKPKKW